jgi:hypothetical protein
MHWASSVCRKFVESLSTAIVYKADGSKTIKPYTMFVAGMKLCLFICDYIPRMPLYKAIKNFDVIKRGQKLKKLQ